QLVQTVEDHHGSTGEEQTFDHVRWGSTLVMGGEPGFDVVQAVLTNKDKAFSQSGWEYFIGPFFRRGLMLLDFDEHMFHRRLMQQAFVRPRLEGYLERVISVVGSAAWEPGRLLVYPAMKQLTLDDGTVVHFDGVKRWVYLQVSHDPGQVWVLVFAICLIVGIGTSLTIRRRRLWVRAAPTDEGRTVVEVGGLARTDQAGYGEEFTRLSTDMLERNK
ncbi:cytochrome c biogenesis protein ResB, partial [Kibdelosporangium lantanae]